MGDEARALRRVGIIGDVHGEADALDAVLTFLAGVPGLDALLCTGDLPAKKGVGDTERCCRLLTQAGVLTIRGNHDRWYIENDEVRAILGVNEALSFEARRFLRDLPPTREFETPHGTLLLCHGIGLDDNDRGLKYLGGPDAHLVMEKSPAFRRLYEDRHTRLLVGGHAHRRQETTFEHLTVLNAGTLYWEDAPGFLIADFDAGAVRCFDLEPFTNVICEVEPIRLD
jgi:predicted phosphodiesterase